MPTISEHIALLEESLREAQGELARAQGQVAKLTAALAALKEIDGGGDVIPIVVTDRPLTRNVPQTRIGANAVLDSIVKVLTPTNGSVPALTLDELTNHVGLSKAYVRRLMYRLRDEGRAQSEVRGGMEPALWRLVAPKPQQEEWIGP